MEPGLAPTHYDTLGVSPHARPEVIRAAYVALAKLHHPDGATPNEERMKQVNQAWDVLSAPEARAAYDAELARQGWATGAPGWGPSPPPPPWGPTPPPPPPPPPPPRWRRARSSPWGPPPADGWGSSADPPGAPPRGDPWGSPAGPWDGDQDRHPAERGVGWEGSPDDWWDPDPDEDDDPVLVVMEPMAADSTAVLGRRFGAHLVDLAIVTLPGVGLVRLGLPGRMAMLVSVALFLWMHVVIEGQVGRTPGKTLCQVRTVQLSGQPPGVGRALVRTLLWPIDSFPWVVPLVGAHVAQRSGGHRRLGDLVAGTFVVRAEDAGWPLVAVAPEGYDVSGLE